MDHTTPLAAVMERNRLQQKHIADALGVSEMTVLRWFHGRTVPTGTNLIRLVDYLRQFEPALTAEDILPPPEVDPAAERAPEPEPEASR